LSSRFATIRSSSTRSPSISIASLFASSAIPASSNEGAYASTCCWIQDRNVDRARLARATALVDLGQQSSACTVRERSSVGVVHRLERGTQIALAALEQAPPRSRW
jgi:hypothetical protein